MGCCPILVFRSCRSAENIDALERTFCSKVAKILFPTSSPAVFSADNCHPVAALWEYARLYQFVTSVDSRCLAQRPFDLFSRAWTSITLYSINTIVTQYRYNVNAFVSLNLKSCYSEAQQWVSGGPQLFYGPQIQHFQSGKLPFKDKTLSKLSPF